MISGLTAGTPAAHVPNAPKKSFADQVNVVGRR
jgi:hypothetical protein